VQEIRFDRLGAFKFSFEPDTDCEISGDPVPNDVKDDRLDKLMLLQQNISLQINQTFVGQTLDMLVEGYDNGITIGRSYRDAPEIDGLVLAEGQAKVGQIVQAKIGSAMAYDLSGTLI
jgi:ribosomal protein S12 methylthiotransferase